MRCKTHGVNCRRVPCDDEMSMLVAGSPCVETWQSFMDVSNQIWWSESDVLLFFWLKYIVAVAVRSYVFYYLGKPGLQWLWSWTKTRRNYICLFDDTPEVCAYVSANSVPTRECDEISAGVHCHCSISNIQCRPSFHGSCWFDSIASPSKTPLLDLQIGYTYGHVQEFGNCMRGSFLLWTFNIAGSFFLKSTSQLSSIRIDRFIAT